MTPRYQVVKAPTELQLADRVSVFMAEGWQCQGSPHFDNDRLVWFQAMTRPPQEGDARLREPLVGHGTGRTRK